MLCRQIVKLILPECANRLESPSLGLFFFPGVAALL
jgi:hypothetical protein